MYLLENRTCGTAYHIFRTTKEVKDYISGFNSYQNIVSEKIYHLRGDIYYTLYDNYIYNFYIIENKKVYKYSQLFNKIKLLNSTPEKALEILIDDIENYEFIF